MGVLADALRSQLRELAQSDARLYRSIADSYQRQSEICDEREMIAISFLRSRGYTVTR